MILKNCNKDNFIEVIDDHKVICFGAGSEIKVIIQNQRIPRLADHIECFVDNDKEKWGKMIEIEGREYPIYAPDLFGRLQNDRFVILITCMYYTEIYNQLEGMKVLSNVPCYMLDSIVSDYKYDLDKFFKQELLKDSYRHYREILQDLNLKNRHKGERCFIIGTGPSLKVEDLERLKNEVTFASNKIYLLFDKTKWRPTYYNIIDYYILEADFENISKIEAEIRFMPKERAVACGVIDERFIYYNRKTNYLKTNGRNQVQESETEIEFSDDIVELVHGGDSVTYDMIQIAAYMGFREIYLLGMDHTYNTNFKCINDVDERRGNHFSDSYEENMEKMPYYKNATLDMLTKAYIAARRYLEPRGVHIYNATRGGKLEVFKRVEFDELFSTEE